MSQKITLQEVRKIMQLSRLAAHPSDEELAKYQAQLEAILEYADQLGEVDVTGIDSLDGSRTIAIDELRADVTWEDEEEYQRIRQNIINNFPTSKGNLLVVNGVFAGD